MLAELVQRPVRTVLDLGAGSGVLGLIAHHVAHAERTVLVERNADFAAWARYNAARAEGDVEVVVADLREWHAPDRFDLVVTNPPWFAPGAGRVSSNPISAAATHADHGDFADFVAVAERCLSPDGAVLLAAPADAIAVVLAAALGASLHPAAITLLHARHTGRPHRAWIELQRTPAPLARRDLSPIPTRGG